MQSLGKMMARPLLVSAILEHGSDQFGMQQVVSRETHGSIHNYTFRDMANRAKQLANALHSLGLKPGNVVGSIAWNNYRHLESWTASTAGKSLLGEKVEKENSYDAELDRRRIVSSRSQDSCITTRDAEVVDLWS